MAEVDQHVEIVTAHGVGQLGERRAGHAAKRGDASGEPARDLVFAIGGRIQEQLEFAAVVTDGHRLEEPGDRVSSEVAGDEAHSRSLARCLKSITYDK